jgi:septum formation protein
MPIKEIILASASPRRKELLTQMGVTAICLPVDLDESKRLDEDPSDYCQRLALEKAQTGWDRSNQQLPVLGSDTIVAINEEILGKPKSHRNAYEMLMKLSNNTHQVHTAVAMVYNRKIRVVESISDVVFDHLDETEVKTYIQSNEPMDKAGSYGIQGYASKWIKYISGSYSGIMGLPIYETSKLLREFE